MSLVTIVWWAEIAAKSAQGELLDSVGLPLSILLEPSLISWFLELLSMTGEKSLWLTTDVLLLSEPIILPIRSRHYFRICWFPTRSCCAIVDPSRIVFEPFLGPAAFPTIFPDISRWRIWWQILTRGMHEIWIFLILSVFPKAMAARSRKASSIRRGRPSHPLNCQSL